jgi:hypothetical protein
MNRKQLEKFLNDPMCSGVMHRINWGRLTPEDKELVSNLLCSSDLNDNVENHIQIQKILDQYPTDEELN